MKTIKELDNVDKIAYLSPYLRGYQYALKDVLELIDEIKRKHPGNWDCYILDADKLIAKIKG